jgi:carboxylesterase type B
MGKLFSTPTRSDFGQSRFHPYFWISFSNTGKTNVMLADVSSPRAPAFDASLFEQQVLIQAVIDETPSPRMSGTECLNLNITVPCFIERETTRKLPVMVFIHGGGFIMGSNSAPYFDPSRLVALSVEFETPLIVVSIK